MTGRTRQSSAGKVQKAHAEAASVPGAVAVPGVAAVPSSPGRHNAGTKPGAKPGAKPFQASFLPLAIPLLLVLFVGSIFFIFFTSPNPGVASYPVDGGPGECQPGEVQSCQVGNCSGASICLPDGGWGDCRWERTCAPGSRIPCVKDGCAYAYRECDQCGSGYGGCVVPVKQASG